MKRTVSVIIDGAEYEKDHDDECPVCVHPLGFPAEGLIAKGHAYAEIADFTRKSGGGILTPAQLRAHVPHMAAFQRVEREALDAASGARNDDRGSLVTASQLTRLESEGILDFSTSYSFSQHYMVRLQASNLTNQVSRYYWNNDPNQLARYDAYGRRFQLDFTFKY